jgi:serine/threonine-protein kinase mTOR
LEQKRLINNRLFSLINSDNYHHKIGAIFSIEKLIKGEFDEDTKTKITRFNYLRLSLNSKETRVIEYSARALGSFSRLNEILLIESVNLEIQRALEAIRSSSNASIEKKKGSIFVLIEILKNAPQLFYPFLADFFSSVWDIMRDPDLEIRKLSSLALRLALTLASERGKSSNQSSNENLLNFYLQALKSLENPNKFWKHASLLAVGELLINSFCKSFILQNISEIYSKIISLRDSKEKFIKAQVFNLIPFLSRVDPTLFSKVISFLFLFFPFKIF